MSKVLNKINELMKLPQSLCNTCGKCCRIASFKGGLNHKEILALINDPNAEPSQRDGAKDFLTIFIPYASLEEAKKVAPGFVKNVQKSHKNAEFFYCKYIDQNNLCKVHEDRPLLCRMYPIPHERTFYHPECGFKKQGEKNWKEIEKIMKDLEEKAKSLK